MQSSTTATDDTAALLTPPPAQHSHMKEWIEAYSQTSQLYWSATGELKKNGRTINPQALFGEFVLSPQAINGNCSIPDFLEALKLYVRVKGKADVSNAVYRTAETIHQHLEYAFEACGVQISGNGESIRRAGLDIQYEAVEALVKEYTREYNRESHVPGGQANETWRACWDVGRISDSLKVFIADSDLYSRRAISQRIAADQSIINSGLTFSYLMNALKIWDVQENHTLCAVVIMQWMWQVKRYLKSEDVLEPIMVNIMGTAQGTMKTSFITALTTPFRDYRVPNARLKQILDEREYTLWAKKYVVIFDELQRGRMEKSEFGELITAMKSLLTSQTVGGRVMKTTSHIEMKRIFSAISSSNSTITSVIRDKTGMRRFFEMTVGTSIRANPEMVRVVEWLKVEENANMLWRGVDENLPTGYLINGYKEAMYAVQDSWKIVEPVDLWLVSGDIRDVPVTRDTIPAEHYQFQMEQIAGISSKKDIMALNNRISPYIWVLDYKLHKDAVAWVEEEMGKEAARYMPGREHFTNSLMNRGVIMRTVGYETYALCTGSVAANTIDQIPGGLV